jgi:hypothetical protein
MPIFVLGNVCIGHRGCLATYPPDPLFLGKERGIKGVRLISDLGHVALNSSLEETIIGIGR